MLSNYLLFTLKNLRRHPVLSLVKVLSLVLGLSCSILVLMHVQYSFSSDKHFPNWQNIYRMGLSLTLERRVHTTFSSDLLADQMSREYSQIENTAKIQYGGGRLSREGISIRENFYWAEPSFLEIFAIEFVAGDAASALSESNSLVLNETMARKHFGDEDPVGQILTLDNRIDLRVTAVMRDLPKNTHSDFKILISVEAGRQLHGPTLMNRNTWTGFSGTVTYIQLRNQAEAESIAADLDNFLARNVPEQQQAFVEQADFALAMEPLSEAFLSPREDPTRIKLLYGLALFAALILLTSGTNFANLSLSQIQQRGKEIGLRKTVGASRGQITTQFLFESMLLTLLALLISLPIVYFSIPVYTELTSTGFTSADLLQSTDLLWIIIFVFVTGFLSGLFPALALSRFSPAYIMKGLRTNSRASQFTRLSITVAQYSFSITLVILAVAINLQIKHLNTMDMGLNGSNLLVIDTLYDPGVPNAFSYDALVNQIQAHSGVVSIGKSQFSQHYSGGGGSWRRPEWGADETRPISFFRVDENYLANYQIELLAGRGFSQQYPTDFVSSEQDSSGQNSSVIITETTLSKFGFNTAAAALGNLIQRGDQSYQIVGVIKDFELRGGLGGFIYRTGILLASDQPLRFLAVRIDPLQMEGVLDHIDRVWETSGPAAPISRIFFEQSYRDLVFARTNGINIASLFAAIITIGIASLGLYALAYYSSQRRTKEVGIRKVLGATSHSIIRLLTWDFVKPVLVACGLSLICGYYATDYFFSQFSSQPELSLAAYFLIMFSTVFLAIVTVSSECAKAANADPIWSLRYE